MSAATLKAAALVLLATGSGWTKGANARLANGLPCSPGHPDAVTFDIQGALLRAQYNSSEPNYGSLNSVYNTLRGKIPGGSKNSDIESYNDDSNVLWAQIASIFA